MAQLSGKVALVTGGASGIGAACVEALAGAGAKVAVTDVDDPRGAQVVAVVAQAGNDVAYWNQDVTDEARWPELVAEIERRWGRLDIVVANAGIGIMGPAVEMSLKDWRRQMAINLDAVFLSVKYTVPALRRAGGGSIVMISSVAGLRGAPGLAG
jgi:NAD(P)-dependent dehydrogenase (short-subunit alcohol dehydrogenase family)